MIEDKLYRVERIRLEALNQAVASEPRAHADSIIKKAVVFENYIKNGEK